MLEETKMTLKFTEEELEVLISAMELSSRHLISDSLGNIMVHHPSVKIRLKIHARASKALKLMKRHANEQKKVMKW